MIVSVLFIPAALAFCIDTVDTTDARSTAAEVILCLKESLLNSLTETTSESRVPLTMEPLVLCLSLLKRALFCCSLILAIRKEFVVVVRANNNTNRAHELLNILKL